MSVKFVTIHLKKPAGNLDALAYQRASLEIAGIGKVQIVGMMTLL